MLSRAWEVALVIVFSLVFHPRLIYDIVLVAPTGTACPFFGTYSSPKLIFLSTLTSPVCGAAELSNGFNSNGLLG